MATVIERLQAVAEGLRGWEAPFKAAGDHRGLGIGAAAIVVEDAIKEIERLKTELTARDSEIEGLRGEGYRAGVDACLRLMAKWFFMSNKDAKACVAEMRALRSSKPGGT